MKGHINSLAAEVGRWHREIFGSYDPVHHVQAIGQKAAEEARELHDADTYDKMRLEVADLLICGLAAADRLEMDAESAVKEKLAILIERGLTQLQRDKDRGITQAKDRG